MKKDPVTKEIRSYVMNRDGGCVAPLIEPTVGLCRDQYGNAHNRGYRPMLTLDHVKSEPRMGVRAPSDPTHLVTLCHFHHLGSSDGGRNWATANRAALRNYLAIEALRNPQTDHAAWAARARGTAQDERKGKK